MATNIGALLDRVAAGAPDRVVLGSKPDGWTATDLRARARTLASRFIAEGASRVAYVGLNSDTVPLCFLAAALAGVPFAPLNYRLSDDTLAALVRRLGPGTIVVRGELGPTAAAEGAGTLLPDVDAGAIAVLLFTSGTTGEPKAAVLRHRHLAAFVTGTAEYLGSDEADAHLLCLPPYHVAGIAGFLTALYSGRRIVYLPAFDAAEWVRVVADERITQVTVVPTMLGRVLEVMDAQHIELPSLQRIRYGGGRMPLALIERAMTMLPDVDFINAYGLTEASSTVAALTPDEHRDAFASTDPAVHRRLVSVGRALPAVELEVRGPDGGVLPAGVQGEIFVRGDQVAGEYLDRTVLTADGWFATNDEGVVDADGYVTLEGRLDDVIVRGAENISPGEIEDTLIAHPAVLDAAVVGVPDPEWGEAIAAVVVVAEGASVTEQELQEWVRDRLRSAKTPQHIHFVQELPYNDTGKLLRRAVRASLESRGD